MQKTQNVSQTCPKIKFSDEAISALKLKSWLRNQEIDIVSLEIRTMKKKKHMNTQVSNWKK
tara:strand:- start:172 stop:354 length:183 start_codon:yes stop_codon:yes gene_type:complete